MWQHASRYLRQGQRTIRYIPAFEEEKDLQARPGSYCPAYIWTGLMRQKCSLEAVMKPALHGHTHMGAMRKLGARPLFQSGLAAILHHGNTVTCYRFLHLGFLLPANPKVSGVSWGEVSGHLHRQFHAARRFESQVLDHVPRRMRQNPYDRPQNRPAHDAEPMVAEATLILPCLCFLHWRISLLTHDVPAED